jgi:hypothetical protein
MTTNQNLMTLLLAMGELDDIQMGEDPKKKAEDKFQKMQDFKVIPLIPQTDLSRKVRIGSSTAALKW